MLSQFRFERSWIPAAATFTVSGILFCLGAFALLVVNIHKSEGTDVFFDLFRDLGIAFVVSGATAALFEIHHHLVHEMRTIHELIDTTMGEKITPEVWKDVNQLLEYRKVIRRNVTVRFCLDESSIAEGRGILRVQQSYQLCGLTDQFLRTMIEHHLDYQFQDSTLALPRFESIEITTPGAEPERFNSKRLKAEFPDGRFSYSVSAMPHGQEGIQVALDRYESATVPGSYNLYSADFIKGLTITFGEWPADMKPEIWVRPHGEGMNVGQVGDEWVCERLLLPGQGVEVKFLKKDAPQATAGSAG